MLQQIWIFIFDRTRNVVVCFHFGMAALNVPTAVSRRMLF